MPKISSGAPFSISQNFLTSAKTIQRLLRITSLCASDHVIEIGAGKGHITRALTGVCRAVSAYEIDSWLYDQLRSTTKSLGNLSVKNLDFLKTSLPKRGEYKVFSNIPFCVTTGIMRKLTTAANPPKEAWLVMEKGAAKRFMGRPNDTPASILIKPFFETRIAYHFSRQDFHPAPSVDVVLMHLSLKASPDIPKSEQGNFASFVENARAHGLNRLLTKRQIATALRLAGLPSIEESGTILYIQWLCLFRCYCQFKIASVKL